MLSILCFGCGAYTVGNNSTPATILSAIFTYAKELRADVTISIITRRSIQDPIRERVEEIFTGICGQSSRVSFRFELEQEVDITSFSRPMCSIVATPDQSHYTLIKKLLLCRVPVLCVKPLVTTQLEYKELLGLSDMLRVPVICEFHKRYDPSLNYLYTALRLNEELDHIRSVDIFYKQPSSDYVCQSRSNADTNVFQYLGVHFIDVISWLTKSTLSDVRFTLFGQQRSGRIDSLSEWQTTNGARFNLQMTNAWDALEASPKRSEQSVRVITNKSDYIVDLADRGISRVDHSCYRCFNPLFSYSFVQGDGLLSQRGYAYDCIRTALEVFASFDCNITNGGSSGSSDHRIAYIDRVRDSIVAVEMCNNWLASIGL